MKNGLQLWSSTLGVPNMPTAIDVMLGIVKQFHMMPTTAWLPPFFKLGVALCCCLHPVAYQSRHIAEPLSPSSYMTSPKNIFGTMFCRKPNVLVISMFQIMQLCSLKKYNARCLITYSYHCQTHLQSLWTQYSSAPLWTPLFSFLFQWASCHSWHALKLKQQNWGNSNGGMQVYLW